MLDHYRQKCQGLSVHEQEILVSYSTVVLIWAVQHANAILRGHTLCRGAQDDQFNGSAGHFWKVDW